MVVEFPLRKVDESTALIDLGRVVFVSPSRPDVAVAKRPFVPAEIGKFLVPPLLTPE